MGTVPQWTWLRKYLFGLLISFSWVFFQKWENCNLNILGIWDLKQVLIPHGWEVWNSETGWLKSHHLTHLCNGLMSEAPFWHAKGQVLKTVCGMCSYQCQRRQHVEIGIERKWDGGLGEVGRWTQRKACCVGGQRQEEKETVGRENCGKRTEKCCWGLPGSGTDRIESPGLKFTSARRRREEKSWKGRVSEQWICGNSSLSCADLW
jgi:hypothetical protein